MNKFLKMIKQKNNKGFTLIELMVVVLIISFLTIGLVSFFSGGIRSWTKGQGQLKAQREARQVFESMIREIREGKSVTGSSLSIEVVIPALDTEPEKTITYLWSGTAGDPLYRDANILIDNVKYLSFNPQDSKVDIILEIDVDNNGKSDISLETELKLRNYNLPVIE